MLAEVSAGLSSLKAAYDITKGLDSAKTQAAINDAKIPLQQYIVDAQQALFAANEAQLASAQRIAELEQTIAGFENWETEKQRYQLKAIDAGAFAYMHQPGMENGEPAVWLCQTCFQKRHASPLQFRTRVPDPGGTIRGQFAKWGCNLCKSEVSVYYGRKPHIPWEPEGGNAPEPPPTPSIRSVKLERG